MPGKKRTFRIALLLAILAGAISLQLLRANRIWLFSGLIPAWFSSSYPKDIIDARELFPNEPSLLLYEDADFYLSLFRTHSDRPWYLWRWWLTNPARSELPTVDRSGLPLSRQTPELRQQFAAFAATLDTLEELNPENGYPLFLRAWLEAKEGMTLSMVGGKSAAEVVSVEHAAKAVRLLRGAIARKEYTMYGKEAGAEWLGILGTPETYTSFLIASSQIAALPIPYLTIPRDTAQRLVAEARRRAEIEARSGGGAATETAYEILHDLQTIGARIGISEPNLITVMNGYSVITIATEEGAAVLNDAGQTEAAERLMARGREMLRPFILARLMRYDPDSFDRDPVRLELQPLHNDQKLIQEAKELFALRRKHQADNPSAWVDGSSRALFVPSLSYTEPWISPAFTLDELKISARFESLGIQKLMGVIFLTFAWAVFLVLVLLYGAHSLLYRKSAASSWPTLVETLVCGAIFAGFAAGPGVAAASIGNFLWESAGRFFLWQIFWNVWGLFAACWVLAFWIRLRTGGQSGTNGGRILLWLAFAGLLAAVPCAYLVYSGVIKKTQSDYDISQPLLAAWKLLAIMFVPAFITGFFFVLRWVRTLLNRYPEGASFTPRLRLLLAGWAVGMLLWLGSYWIVEWQERKWAVRDSLIIPRQTVTGYTPIEGRAIDVHVRNLERALGSH